MGQKTSLPEYLKYLRKAYGYTQKDIAEQLHISRQTYSHYETGRITPSINGLYHIAQIYKIPLHEILEHVKMDASAANENVTMGEDADRLLNQEFLTCLRSLNEKDRAEILSIMWEIMQVKKKQANKENVLTDEEG
jgi:transcriptional regulator with XRE-family HTH domain